MNFQLFEGDSDAACECTCINCPVHGKTSSLKLSAVLSSVIETNENIDAPDINMNEFNTVLTSMTPLQESNIQPNKEILPEPNNTESIRSPDKKVFEDEGTSNAGSESDAESSEIVESFKKSMRINRINAPRSNSQDSDSYGSDLDDSYESDSSSSPRRQEYNETMRAFRQAKRNGNDPYKAMTR